MANATSNGHAAISEIRNPGSYITPSGVRTLFVISVVIGAATFAGGLVVEPHHAWASFLQNHFYFLSLALGGAFFASIQWLTGAMWSAPVRRLSESFTAYLPVAAITFAILYFGVNDLYIWSHADHVKGDLVLEGKAAYLNVSFFMIRNLVAIGLWIYFSWKMIRNSVAQDATKDPVYTLRNRVVAPIFLIIFALTFTMASFDMLMSLDPHWFSTMFGVYCFAGMFYANLASTCLLAIYFKKNGKLNGIVNDNHLHDMGKFMFAFTIFWAYIGFSQFMLIWYANLPEETGYFMRRLHGGWFYVSLFLLLGKFMTPFFLLITRDSKRNITTLQFVGWFMLVAQWIDILWLIQPEVYVDGPHLSWIDLGVTLGFIGLFGLMVSRFLSKYNIVAIGDPKLEQAVFHHHQ